MNHAKICENIPYHVQWLCHEIYDTFLEDRELDKNKIEFALELILKQQTNFFLQTWDALSLYQRKVLTAISTDGGSNLFSASYINRNDLQSQSNLQKSLILLEKKGIVDKGKSGYFIEDTFFKKWIRRGGTSIQW